MLGSQKLSHVNIWGISCPAVNAELKQSASWIQIPESMHTNLMLVWLARIGVLMVLIFDPFFDHFCGHRPSKMKWKMRTMNQPPWNFEKWDQKWVKNGTVHFSAPQQHWTPHLAAGPALFYHFPNAFYQPQIFLESLLIGLQSIISVKNAQIKNHCYFNFAATKRWCHVCNIFIGDLLVQE